MSAENQRPWEKAVELLSAMDGQSLSTTWGDLISEVRVEKIIREACEAHAAELKAENERLNGQLLTANGKWEKEHEAVCEERDRLAAQVVQLLKERSHLTARVTQLRKAVRDNHRWHLDCGDEDYKASDLCRSNEDALAATAAAAIVPASDVEPLIVSVCDMLTDNTGEKRNIVRDAIAAFRAKHPKL